MQWYFYVGLIAAICIAVFTMPQLIQVIKTKNTCGLSAIMLALLVFGDFCFALNGIGILADKSITDVGTRLSGGLPLLLANIIACSISAVLLFIKLRTVQRAKKFGVSEKEFCDNYEAYRTKMKMQKAEKIAEKASASTDVPAEPTTPATPIANN